MCTPPCLQLAATPVSSAATFVISVAAGRVFLNFRVHDCLFYGEKIARSWAKVAALVV